MMHWASKRTGRKPAAGSNWSTEVRDPRLFCLVPERIGRISRHYQKLWQMSSMMHMGRKRPIRSRRLFATARPTSSRKQQRIARISVTCPESNLHLLHQERAPACSQSLEVRGLTVLGIPSRASTEVLPDRRPTASYPETGLEEINGDLLEADFGPEWRSVPRCGGRRCTPHRRGR